MGYLAVWPSPWAFSHGNVNSACLIFRKFLWSADFIKSKVKFSKNQECQTICTQIWSTGLAWFQTIADDTHPHQQAKSLIFDICAHSTYG